MADSMAREPNLVKANRKDEIDDAQLRPQRIGEMVGQRDVIERLEIATGAARLWTSRKCGSARRFGRAVCAPRTFGRADAGTP